MGLRNRNPPLQQLSHSLRECKKHSIMGCRQLAYFFILTKAYDVLNHKVLLDKLYTYGVRANGLNLT
jgi:hypothetical protein